MDVTTHRIKKILHQKIHQLNDIVADLDGLLTNLETDFYRVCIFGSARIKPDSIFYRQVYDLARALSSLGADIVTGGGPGLMEAANKGAKDGSEQTRSIGLPIVLASEPHPNSHLDVKRLHQRFSSRLDEFMRITHAVVATPGGVGTLVEIFFTWQLMQVGHIKERPVILLGKDMWAGLLKWVKAEPLAKDLLSHKDLDVFTVVDSVDEVIKILRPEIHKFYQKNGSSLAQKS